MRLISLWLSLQSSFSPSAADSAQARRHLERALAEYPPPTRTAGTSRVESLFEHQLMAWGLREVALRMAPQFDRAHSTLGSRSLEHRLVTGLLLLEAGDTARVWQLVDSTLQPDRDSLLSRIGSNLTHDNPLALSLEARIQGVGLRATSRYSRGQRAFSHRDTAAARRLIREAVAMAGRDTTARQPAPLNWLVSYYAAGGDITIQQLAERADSQPGPRMWNRLHLVSALVGYRQRAAVVPLIDSLLLEATSGSGRYDLYLHTQLLELRGTTADSARARDLRREAEDRQAAVTPLVPSMHPATRLQAAALSLDTLLLRRELARDSVPLDELHHAMGLVTGTLQTASRRDAPINDMLLRFAGRLVDLSAPHTDTRRGLLGDSLQVARIQLLSFIDVDAAAALSRRLETARMRERALAAVARRWLRRDSDSALALARAIDDEVARNMILPELARRAVSGGQHRLADSLIARIPSVVERVRMHAALASARFTQPDEALRHVRAAFGSLDPRLSCHYCMPAWPAMSSSLVEGVLDMAVRVLPPDEINQWVMNQPDAERRIWANVGVAKALVRRHWPWRQPPGIP